MKTHALVSVFFMPPFMRLFARLVARPFGLLLMAWLVVGCATLATPQDTSTPSAAKGTEATVLAPVVQLEDRTKATATATTPTLVAALPTPPSTATEPTVSPTVSPDISPMVAAQTSETTHMQAPQAVPDWQNQTDIWDRIRQGFAMPDLDNDLVRDRERWYASRPDYMLRMTERSRPY